MNDSNHLRIAVACGGTGGHFFPGLAVANELKLRGHDVEVWLSGRAIESAGHLQWQGPVFFTGARPLKLRNLPAITFAFCKCMVRILRHRPAVLLAMGSYASLPPVLAARLGGVPAVLHEANAVPGKAIGFLSRFATATATSFNEAARWLPGRKVVKTGLPIRTDILRQQRDPAIPAGLFVIFVTGGSQGAHRVNELATQAMCLLMQDHYDKFFVIHQTGAADEGWVRKAYEDAGVKCRVSAFVDNMGQAFASADLVICRAGAATCFELCLLRKPALLIPLPSAIRNHQHLNAVELVSQGGADEGIQAELTGRSLMRYLVNKMSNPAALEAMRAKYHPEWVLGSTARLADLVEQSAAAKTKGNRHE